MQHLILTDAKTTFHYCGQAKLLQHVLDCLERHPNLGSHVFLTPDPSWESIVAYDSYFEDYTLYGTITNPRSQGCPRFQSGKELANSVGKINA